MSEFEINPSSVLKKAAATISLVSTKATFCYSPRGIYIQAVGYAGVVAILRIDNAAASHFLFPNPTIGGFDIDQMELFHPCPRSITGLRTVDSYVYRAVVGIPSLEFMRILTYLISYQTEKVSMIITSTEVTFKLSSLVGSERIVLKTKNKDCIVGGLTSRNILSVPIPLSLTPLFLNAASQTPTVWILMSALIGGHVTFNIPLDLSVGNLMFHLFR